MSRSLAYILTLISVILIGTVIAAKYFGFHVPYLYDIVVAGRRFEITLLSYFLLLLPAVWRR